MSYCRNNGKDSDIYIIRVADPSKEILDMDLECVGCLLDLDRESFVTKFEWCMLLHLDKHADAGHKVPNRARDRLKDEMDA